MSADTAKVEAPKTLTEKIDALFAPWNRTDIPGLVVAVRKDGGIIYRRGFGMASLETSVANTPRTRMRIASMSKQFTGLLASLLAEEGKLDLDAPIRTYIPELTGPGGDPGARLFLQHRGGQRCYLDVGALSHGAFPPPVGYCLTTQARQTGRNFAPGEAMIYNNGGYNLISTAIDRVTGDTFEEQLRKRIFAPLGMADTASIPSDYVITPGIATMHIPLPDGFWRRGLFRTEENRGEGAIVSTVDDILRWTAHLRTRDKLGSKATWEAMTTKPIFPDGSVGHYGLGLMMQIYRGVPVLRHSGGVAGGSSEMLTFPEHGLDVVILCNGGPGAEPPKLAKKVADIVLEGRLGAPQATVDASDYRAALGDWWSPETGMLFNLAAEDGVVKMAHGGMPYRTPLERLADGSVIAAMEGMGPVRFDLDKAGGEMTIVDLGRGASYRKLSKDAADAASFARDVVAQYYSHDADCTATLTQKGDGLVASFSDGYGRIATHLTPLGDTVATTSPVNPVDGHYTTLTFDRPGGRGKGFRLNSGRTRNLVFERV